MNLSRLLARVGLAGLSGVVTGCSSSSDGEEPTGPCALRQGSYRVVAVQRSGTCGRDGEGGEAIVTFDQQSGYASGGAGCQVAYARATDDNCVIEYDETCPLDIASLPNGRIRKVGKATWNKASTSASVSEQWTLYDASGRTECTSAMDVSITKQ